MHFEIAQVDTLSRIKHFLLSFFGLQASWLGVVQGGMGVVEGLGIVVSE